MSDGGPAFPSEGRIGDVPYVMTNPGMSLRDWFAGRALPQALAASATREDYDYVAAAIGAYQIADAMLAERTAEHTKGES